MAVVSFGNVLAYNEPINMGEPLINNSFASLPICHFANVAISHGILSLNIFTNHYRAINVIGLPLN